MKVVFVGPSLPDAADVIPPDIQIRPPACQGDIMKALRDGATVIGLIDGQFEYVAPVWHKELLFALSSGVTVLGAASMGALRAAECAPYGMIGIGRIFSDYLSGRRVDDADVALIHGPAELNYPPLSVPMVNVDATLSRARELGPICDRDVEHLAAVARAIHYKDRSWRRILRESHYNVECYNSIIESFLVNQKRLDALALLETIRVSQFSINPRNEWVFQPTTIWRKLYG
ncbi:TfuA-like protein [Agrobacterium sp. ES01]|uniref:TfuA-like protein n=1 Tax=Agrobacterium sp. ES01 TaxID=3420714 RepID=UPI003D14364B